MTEFGRMLREKGGINVVKSVFKRGITDSGVYAFFIDDTLAYIGQALDLTQRFNMGYRKYFYA